MTHLESIVDGNKNLIAQEMLLRWNHPTMGLLFPGAFLPTAQNSNIMREIDHWVIQQGLNYSTISSVPVAINLADTTLCDRDFQKKLQILGIQDKLSYLEVEIHELSTLSPTKLQNIEFLANLGIKIILDDYGSGNAEIQKILLLPVSRIKIDRSLVQRRKRIKYQTVIRNIVNLCQELSIETCAEGIETKEEFEDMRYLGCNLFQGYLFSDNVHAER